MLAKRLRLTKRGSFAYVYKNGAQSAVPAIRLAYIKSKGLRIGFSVGAKIGKAVRRNKVKRRMRYAARQLVANIKGGYQMVFVAKPAVVELCYKEIFAAMQGLLKRAGII